MPGWGWIVLTILCLAAIVLSIVYVILRGLHVLKTVVHVTDLVSPVLDALQEQDERDPLRDPVFTEPLTVSAARYRDAHVGVLARKEATRQRHLSTWRRWKHDRLDSSASALTFK